MTDSPSAPARHTVIAKHFIELITTGKMGPDEKLPSVAQTARTFGVAQKQAQTAYENLREAGLVYSTPAGTFVAQPVSFVTPAALALRELEQGERPPQEKTTHLTAGTVTNAPGYILAFWGLPDAAPVGRRESVTTFRGKPRLAVSWHPPHIIAHCPELVADPPRVIERGTLHLAVDRLGHWDHLFNGTDYMRARRVYKREARLLHVRRRSPVLAIVAVRCDGEGVIEIVELVYPEHVVVEYDWSWARQR